MGVYIEVELTAGPSIDESLAELCAVSKRLGVGIAADVNEVRVSVWPGDEASDLAAAFYEVRKSNRAHKFACASMARDRVKPTARPWNAEDAKRHVGWAYRTEARIGIIGVLPSGELSAGDELCYWEDWSGDEYARPIPGTDPATWDWKKCEVVE